ncbi:hypothetical protein DL769_009592 [Monosporascus sp. CRB-8-3]|nr:hypothetical protein DL769_009592 [Monosporascus sp. CRB-8-3]
MKFLCLHGNGSNSIVMQQQTAGLRHELEGEHEYEFVEATAAGPMAEDVASLATSDQSFFYYWDPADYKGLHMSIEQLDTYIHAEGPFDVIMGFSAGSLLAAMYILGLQNGTAWQGGRLPFKCAIFVCTAGIGATAKSLGLNHGTERIKLPTVHIWGSKDHIETTGGADLVRICDAETRRVVVHDGGHEFPKGTYLTAAVHAIRRTISP